MLNDKICKLREELNNSIESGQDYSITYKISVELDDLIATFYKEGNEKINKSKNIKMKILSKA